MAVAPMMLWLGAAQGVGSLVAGYQEAEDAGFRASVARQDAEITSELTRQNAAVERARGAEEAADIGRANRRMLASTIAGIGAGGVDFSGTAMDLVADDAAEGAMAVQRSKSATEMRASGIEVRGALSERQSLAQASMWDNRASQAKTMGWFNLGTSIIGGGADYYSTGGTMFT